MGEPGDLDYAFFTTLDEVLKEVLEQIDMARNSNMTQLGWRLKMASRALRCAMEIYGDEVAGIKEKKNAKI